jgi:hypothetical protein
MGTNVRRINVSFANMAIQENDLFNYFTIAIMVKELFRSSCVHRYTKNGLAKKLGISTATIEKAVKIGLKMGLCHIEGSSLIFSKITGNRAVKVSTLPKTFKELKNYIKSLIIVDKLRTINFSRHIKQAKLNKKCVWNGQRKGKGVISYKRLGEILSCSKPTAIKIIKFAVKESLINKLVIKARLGMSESGQGMFYAYGKVFCQPANIYTEAFALRCI